MSEGSGKLPENENPTQPAIDASDLQGRHGSGRPAPESVPGRPNRHQAPDKTIITKFGRVVPESRPDIPILGHPDNAKDNLIRAQEEVDFDEQGHLKRSEVIETTDADGNVIQRVEVPGGFDEEIGPDDK